MIEVIAKLKELMESPITHDEIMEFPRDQKIGAFISDMNDLDRQLVFEYITNQFNAGIEYKIPGQILMGAVYAGYSNCEIIGNAIDGFMKKIKTCEAEECYELYCFWRAAGCKCYDLVMERIDNLFYWLKERRVSADDVGFILGGLLQRVRLDNSKERYLNLRAHILDLTTTQYQDYLVEVGKEIKIQNSWIEE